MKAKRRAKLLRAMEGFELRQRERAEKHRLHAEKNRRCREVRARLERISRSRRELTLTGVYSDSTISLPVGVVPER